MQVGIHTLQVLQHDALAEQLFVEGQREAPIQVVTMEDGHADDAAHKVEVGQVLLQKWREEISKKKHGVNKDVMVWKYFLHFWFIVKGIHLSPEASITKDQKCRGMIFVTSLKLLNKQPIPQWLATCQCSYDMTGL